MTSINKPRIQQLVLPVIAQGAATLAGTVKDSDDKPAAEAKIQPLIPADLRAAAEVVTASRAAAA